MNTARNVIVGLLLVTLVALGSYLYNEGTGKHTFTIPLSKVLETVSDQSEVHLRGITSLKQKLSIDQSGNIVTIVPFKGMIESTEVEGTLTGTINLGYGAVRKHFTAALSNESLDYRIKGKLLSDAQSKELARTITSLATLPYESTSAENVNADFTKESWMWWNNARIVGDNIIVEYSFAKSMLNTAIVIAAIVGISLLVLALIAYPEMFFFWLIIQ